MAHRLDKAKDPGLIDFLKEMAQTVIEAHDRLYVEQANFARTIPIPTLGVRTTQFNLSRERALELYESGRAAAKDFLTRWDMDEYVERYRSGDVPSRRDTLTMPVPRE